MDTPVLSTWIPGRAAIVPDDIAIVHGDHRLTYGDFATRIRVVAARLAERGVGRGDRVAFHGHNEPAALEVLFAAVSLGAAWVPIHPARPADEVAFILDDADVAVLVRGRADTAPATTRPTLAIRELVGDAAVDSGPAVELEDLAILAYTSGTTGQPKGVLLTHRNVFWNVFHVLAACELSQADVVLGAAPLTRIGGLGVTLLPALFVGASVAIPRAGDGATVLETIVRERVSVVFANPDLLEAMERAPAWAAADLTSIRVAIVGGGVAHEALIRRYQARGIALRHGYGLTEAAPMVTLLDERDAVTHARTVGRVIGFVQARVVREDDEPCAPDEVGELLIHGPNVTSGYWRRPDATAAARLGDWWRTGDAVSMDAAGYVTHVDRVSDALVLGGSRVYPAELERRVYGAAGVADVAASAIDGALVLAVVADGAGTPDVDALRRRVAAALPGGVAIDVRDVPEIPRNAARKILRARLAAALQSEGA